LRADSRCGPFGTAELPAAALGTDVTAANDRVRRPIRNHIHTPSSLGHDPTGPSLRGSKIDGSAEEAPHVGVGQQSDDEGLLVTVGSASDNHARGFKRYGQPDSHVASWHANHGNARPLIAEGLSSEEAAVAYDASMPLGPRWFREGGGMPPISLDPPSGRYLPFAEREELVVLRGIIVSHRMTFRSTATAWKRDRLPVTGVRQLTPEHLLFLWESGRSKPVPGEDQMPYSTINGKLIDGRPPTASRCPALGSAFARKIQPCVHAQVDTVSVGGLAASPRDGGESAWTMRLSTTGAPGPRML
jgi:hypothetical protein